MADQPTTEKPIDCDEAKRQHSWSWAWNGNTWTNDRICNTCGKQEFNVKDGNLDGYDRLGLPRK